MFENKKFFILGFAKSGYEVAKTLAKHNNKIIITDIKEQDKDKVDELEKLGIKVIITDKPEDLLNESYDYIVKNPGIKLKHPVCVKAEKLNIKIISEVDVAYEFLKDKVDIIAITGSNGKTTTTTLVYEFLKEHKCNVKIGGNMGFPVCSFVDKAKKGDILVLEIAGHHLYNCYTFKTNVSILTNLSEVHLDHFGDYETYKKTKVKIFNNHTNKDINIYNAGNKDVVEQINKNNFKGKNITFTTLANIKSNLYLKNDAIYYNDEKIIDTKDIKIKGNHNYENIMCAIAATFEYGVTKEDVYNVLSKFNGVEHRIEFVRKINNIDFYNDSKATNVKSTQIALSTFNNDTILIMGGLDRGHSFDDLKDYLGHTKLIICYGQTKERIKQFANKINKACIVVDNLKEAVEVAYENAKENYIVLLSPACASWDQYKCFEDRGDEFKNIVNKLV